MPGVLLDTDTLSEIMKGRNATAVARATQYVGQQGPLAFSLITRYEVLRGLKAKNASAQLAAFEARCKKSTIVPITDEIIVRAADLYADLKRRGIGQPHHPHRLRVEHEVGVEEEQPYPCE